MTIFLSKANMEVYRVASTDPFDRGLNGVKIEADGTTVAGNARMLMAVSPVTYEDKLSWPYAAGDSGDTPVEGVIMDVDLLKKIKGGLSKDKRMIFKHALLTKVKDVTRVGFTSINPAGDTVTHSGRPQNHNYPDWKSVMRRVRGEGGEGLKVCVNRSDLIKLLEAMQAAAPDSGGINPAFIEIGADNEGMIIRCQNLQTGQHAIGAIRTFDTKGSWFRKNAWERAIFGIRIAVKKKIAKKLVGK
ncbi:MAG: hypothetical protein GY841_20050 [FCB group bacterium]|nr:hypothetical protein [FCB group bacterium]